MHRFAPVGEFLALAPQAWGMMFFGPPPNRENVRVGDVIVVNVRGPIEHHVGYCDSYDSIKERVSSAIAEKPTAVVLAIDSPGGLVSGCFDTADELRALALASGVPLYAYIDGAALSAGYALACAASRIVIPPTGIAGSIGVMDMRVDATKQDAMMGLTVTAIAVGDRKLDGNPHSPMTEEELAATRARQEVLATLFFDHVARARATTPENLRALRAGLVIGAAAVPLLADQVGSFDQMIAAIAAGTFGAPESAAEGQTTMGSKAYEEAVAALRKAASGDGPDAAKAKRMLKAELEEDETKEDEGAAAAESDDEEGEKKPAEGKAEGEGDKKPEARAGAGAAAASTAVSTSSTGTVDKGALALAAVEDLERRQLLASRPDLDDATKKILASAPIADVRDYVASAPRRPLKPAATAVVNGQTRAAGQTDAPAIPPLPAEEARALDVAMGLHDGSTGIHYEGKTQVLGMMTRGAARAELDRRAKAAAAAAGGGPTR